MRMRRVALLSGVAATVGGLLWWRKSRQTESDEELLVDLSSPDNGSRSSDPQWDKTESEVSL